MKDSDLRAKLSNDILNAYAALENNVCYKYMREHPEDKCPWQIREEKEVSGEIVEVNLLEQK